LRKLAQEQNRAERTRRAAEALQRGGTPEGDASGSEVTTARRGDQDQTGEPFSAEMEQSAGSGNIPGSRGGAGGVPEEAAGDHSNPRASDDLVDLTRGDDELNGRTIAEWGDPRAPTQESSARGSAASQSTVERASRRAERALEQSNVPSRYHDFIRRYFDRRRKVPAEGGG